MKKYSVTLTRVYNVSIRAENEKEAKQFVEFFLGDCKDESYEKERNEKKFQIKEIKLMLNEASDAIEEI